MDRTSQLVAVRVDAARLMGTGHVVRCLALANVLRGRGITVVFLCRPHDGHLCEFIEAEGFKVIRLSDPPRAPAYPEDGSYESWLGTTSKDDARETAEAITSFAGRATWLVVDHYGADDAWERAVRPCTERVLAIDDLGRTHSCDLVLDQNVLDPSARTASTGAALLGPRYALLSAVYADLHPRIPPRRGRATRLFVFLGVAGPLNNTGKVLRAIRRADISNVAVDVVVSRTSPHLSEIQSLAEGQPHISLHHGLPTLAPLMARADLAIGAGGSNSWERLCLGLPTAVITVADNQKAIAEGLHRHNLALWLGHHDEHSEADLAARIHTFVSGDIDTSWSSRCREAVDGNGAKRVAELMMLDASTQLTARHATPADRGFAQEMLGERFDEAAFSATLRDIASHHALIAETPDGIALGYMQFALVKDEWHLACQMHPACAAGAVSENIVAAAILALRRAETEDVQVASVTAQVPAPSQSWRINICSDRPSWINPAVSALVAEWVAAGHRVTWSHNARKLPAADFCFYLSYGRIVDSATLEKSVHNLVVHESDLPKGRGWSPLSWQILEGKNKITATLFEAADSVDSGVIYRQEEMAFDGSELVDELRRKQAAATLSLCRAFVAGFPETANAKRPQEGEATFYPKRTAVDSRIDPAKTLGEQFNQLRIADNARYPAFFDVAGHRYYLRIDKA